MVMELGETLWNNKVGYHSVVSQNEITYVLKNPTYFTLLVHFQQYRLLLFFTITEI